MNKARIVQIVAWSLSLAVTVVALMVWGNDLGWKFSALSAYQAFPLFGLTAFSLMWSHYVASALRQALDVEPGALKIYFNFTAWVVLAAILLHPSLLIGQLMIDGLGLPPFSYYRYVGAYGKLAITLGTLSWLAFLAYELRHWATDKAWWKYVQYLSDAAMIGIFIHSLRLGRHLQAGWFRNLWWFYGASFVLVLCYSYWQRRRRA